MLLVSGSVGAAEPPSARTVTPEATEEARLRFERGIRLFEERENERSLVEFERAYELVGSYKILYNIAQVNVELGRYARAVTAFERYLADGGAEIPAARTESVQRELSDARARTAKILVRVVQPGAEIAIDDRPLATSPMTAAELIDSGQHRVSVRKRDFQAVSRVVVLAGGDQLAVDVDLEPNVRVERTVVVEPTNHTPTWIAWGITAGLAGGCAVSGVLAMGSADDLDRARRTVGSPPAEREELARDAQTFATVSTVLGGAALVSAGVALYLTLRKGARPPAATTASFSGSGLAGTF